MSVDNRSPAREPFGSRVLAGFFNAMRILLRLLLILLLVTIFGLLLFGIPYVYYRIITPIMSKYQHLENVQAEQVTLNQRLLEDLKSMQERANSLEIRLDSDRQQFGELVSLTHMITSTQQAQIESLNATQIASGQAMESLADKFNNLNTEITDLSQIVDQLEGKLKTVEGSSQELEKRLLSDETPIAELRREIQVLKAMELLTRSQLFITQNNFGLAEDDIQNARDILVDLEVPDDQVEILKDIDEKLETALDYLPDSQLLAAQNLEIAWQLLMNDLSVSATSDGALKISDTPTLVLTVNATETSASSSTPTP